jgi:hypothetical protein
MNIHPMAGALFVSPAWSAAVSRMLQNTHDTQLNCTFDLCRSLSYPWVGCQAVVAALVLNPATAHVCQRQQEHS